MIIQVSLTVLLFSVLQLSVSQENDRKIVCYYASWSAYRPGRAKFTPRDIDPNLCTHLVYAFAKISDHGGIAHADPWQDINKRGYLEFNEIKFFNKNIKTLLAIGGWLEGSKKFSRTAALRSRREYFAKYVAQFLRNHNFDGVNIDWQFPGCGEGSRVEDYKNYVDLVKDLRTVFEYESKISKLPRLMVTLSVPQDPYYIERGYDLFNLQTHADFISILCYDYHLSDDLFVGHPAPLFPLLGESGDHPNAKRNVEATINYILAKGVMKQKLNLGIAAFGRAFALKDPNSNRLGAPSAGKPMREGGYRAYYEICKEVQNDNWTVVFANRSAMGPYAYKGVKWVGYDDEFIVQKKVEFARDIGLGGIMFWTIEDDDFRGECSNNRSFPLIRAAREALLMRPKIATSTIAVSVENSATPASAELKPQDIVPISASSLLLPKTTPLPPSQASPLKPSSSALPTTAQSKPPSDKLPPPSANPTPSNLSAAKLPSAEFPSTNPPLNNRSPTSLVTVKPLPAANSPNQTSSSEQPPTQSSIEKLSQVLQVLLSSGIISPINLPGIEAINQIPSLTLLGQLNQTTEESQQDGNQTNRPQIIINNIFNFYFNNSNRTDT